MTGTLSSRILAAIKANPGKSSLEISLLLTNVTRKQVAENATKLAGKYLVENRAEDNRSTAWYSTTSDVPRAPKEQGDAPVLRGPSFRPKGDYTPSPWHVREGSGDALTLPSRRGDTFVTHSAPMGIEGVPPKTQQTVIKKVSPINSATFCKRDPRQANAESSGAQHPAWHQTSICRTNA